MSEQLRAKQSGAPPLDPSPVLQLHDAALGYGRRTLWSGLNLEVARGEFLAVLGANGSGKTSLLRVILGLQQLTSGTLTVAGRPARRGSGDIGYVQQQRRIDPLIPLRGRDIVRQGLDGHRWGIGLPRRGPGRQVEAALDDVGARRYADMPVGLLSGGEQQRLRIAQALVADPPLLLCDEPLLSLDLSSQRSITALVDRRRRTHETSVVFVTHEINPVLPFVDRVLYLAGGRFRIGTVDEVLNSETLSELYGTAVDVFRTRGQILVAGRPEAPQDHHEHGHEEV
ncbi:MAG: metal ABC transporter ATP-binding protein [Jatrophihabitans sp.]